MDNIKQDVLRKKRMNTDDSINSPYHMKNRVFLFNSHGYFLTN